MMFVSCSLTSLNMIISGSIHVAANAIFLYFFFWQHYFLRAVSFMRKIKQGNIVIWGAEVSREDFMEEMTFEFSPEGGKGARSGEGCLRLKEELMLSS